MTKSKSNPRTRTKWREIFCEWCGKSRKVNRSDCKTCSVRCRQRLSTFIRSTGYQPEGIPGDVTAKHAIDLEIFRLLLNEKRRRDAAAAEGKARRSQPTA